MAEITKQRFLDVAEVIDAFRFFPRNILAAYGWFIYTTSNWYMHLPIAERTTDTTAFITAIFGMATYLCDVYIKSGRNWTGTTNVNP